MTTLTELDAAIIAEENGWDYLPACDEGWEALDAIPASAPAPAPAPTINRRKLRIRLIREAMPLVKADMDAQGIANDIYQDDAVIVAYPDNDKREEIAWGVVRFCEHACGVR